MILMFNINRLHPLLVHLPIGIMFFAAVLFVFKKWKRTTIYDASISLALICALGSAVFSAITGWLLSNEGGYDTDFLFWHKWLGISTTLGIFLLLFIYKNQNISKHWSGIFFFITLVLLSLTGHYGGSLTHGSEYLFEQGNSQAFLVDAGLSLDEMPVYEQLIQPILQQKCVSCHKPSKKKGELVMSSFADLVKGGKSGAIFNSEHPQKSELLKRVLLPIGEEKHMPPKGKSQLTDDEVALLEWWIENKTCADCTVADMQNREKVEPILQKYIPTQTTLDTANLDVLTNKQFATLQAKGIQVTSASATSPLIALSLQNQNEIKRSMIKSMKPIRKNISELNLSYATVNEQLIDFISGLDNLQKLQLQHTQVSDKAISKLKNLKNLQSLNLYDTPVSDESIENLTALPILKKLYIWQSAISTEGISQLKKAKPRLEVYAGIDESIFGAVNLNPPIILADTDLFEDSLIVTLKNNLKNSVLHYTLDGSEPDSTSSIYNQAIKLTSSAMVKAIARKKGWEESETNNKQFIKIQHRIVAAKLSSPASPKYPGEGSKTLIDLQKSSIDFRNGKWLGYEGTNLTATLDLAKTDMVSSVFVSALSDPGSWIFYPKAIKVSLSQDGKDFQHANEIQIAQDHRDGTELGYFNVPFAPTESKYIRVEIKSMLKNPDWHPSPGGDSWFFIDEILVN